MLKYTEYVMSYHKEFTLEYDFRHARLSFTLKSVFTRLGIAMSTMLDAVTLNHGEGWERYRNAPQVQCAEDAEILLAAPRIVSRSSSTLEGMWGTVLLSRVCALYARARILSSFIQRSIPFPNTVKQALPSIFPKRVLSVLGYNI